MPLGEVCPITVGEASINSSARCLLCCRCRRDERHGLGGCALLGCCRSWAQSGTVSRKVGEVRPGLGGVASPCWGEFGVVAMVFVSGLWASWEAWSGLLT